MSRTRPSRGGADPDQADSAPPVADVVVLSERRRANEVVRRPRGGNDLAGRRVVVTAGGTREPLDPVRFLGNRSSGRQGVAVAEAAQARGAEVDAHRGAPRGRPARGRRGHRGPDRARTAGSGHRGGARRRHRRDDRRRRRLPSGRGPRRQDQEDRRPASRLTLELVANPDILAGLAAGKREGQIDRRLRRRDRAGPVRAHRSRAGRSSRPRAATSWSSTRSAGRRASPPTATRSSCCAGAAI